MPDQPKISVLIPVYNVKTYLRECLDSLEKQTFPEMEVVCIDDGSTDGSGEILDEYAARDARFNVLHVPNGGYGAAINRGLEAAGGDYVGIVESDDTIAPDIYEKLYRAAADKGFPDVVKADACFCWDTYGYRYRFHRGDREADYGRVLHSDEKGKRFDFLMNIWTGIYLRAFLEQYKIRCHESPGASYQDNGFWMQTMTFAESTLFLNEAGYFYRQDNAGASVKSAGKPLAMDNEYEWTERELAEKGAGLADIARCRYFRLMRNYGSFLRTSAEYKDELVPKMAEEFERYKACVPADTGVYNNYSYFMKDPAGRAAEQKRFRERTFSAWDGAEDIVIYGAGHSAEPMLRMLLNYGYGDKIAGFVVTDPAGQRGHIGAFPVFALKELPEKADLKKTAVILSVSTRSKYYPEMSASLQALGITEWTVLDDMFRYFYLIA